MGAGPVVRDRARARRAGVEAGDFITHLDGEAVLGLTLSQAVDKMRGKVGTDIQDAKCSWLVVQALDRATAAQRAVIEANYGKDDAACIAKIKQVYAELKLEDVFHAYEDRAYAETCAAIDAACDGGSMPRAVFNMVLSKIYKRKA